MNLTAIDNPFSAEQTNKNTPVLKAQISPTPTPRATPYNNNIYSPPNNNNNLLTNSVRNVEIKILDPINKENPSWYQAPIEDSKTGKKIIALKGTLIKELNASVTLNDGTKSNNVKWSSSDSTALTVNPDSGQISTGQVSTKVTVTAISVIDSSKKDIVEIEIVDKANFTLSESAKVNNITVAFAEPLGGNLTNRWRNNGNMATAEIGATIPLTATVFLQDGTKNSKVVWESSDENVATVTEDGKIKPVGLGTTSIIARYKTNPSKKGFVDVQVVSSIPDATFPRPNTIIVNPPVATPLPTPLPTALPSALPTPIPTALPPSAKINEMVLVQGNAAIKDFTISKYEITQNEWTSVVKANPSTTNNINMPVFNVSWLNVIKYCNEKSKLESLPLAYNDIGDLLDATGQITTDLSMVKGYRLPSSEEWEYSARGGNKSFNFTFSGNNDYSKIAWSNLDSAGKVNEVAKKDSNELGLYDMNGNVYEWINDFSTDKTKRLVKGGSYLSPITQINSFLEVDPNKTTDPRTGFLGFRIVKSK